MYSGMYSVLHAVAQLVEALRYKPEGRGFNTRLSHWNFSLTSGRTMALRSTQPLTEMSTRNISWGGGGGGGGNGGGGRGTKKKTNNLPK
jgi:hypothetical protein